ncbi:MAG: tRNA glutamyl-Q(34) synthetase GluQRS [Pseudomonadota bacterium]
MPARSFVTRFAPSPTGYLHLGHAYSALVAARAARDAGGACLLRIEDIDKGRCKPEYEAAILEDLSWLGLSWPSPVRRQSDHFSDYKAALTRLIDKGVVYRCFKTRKEVADAIASAPHAPPAGPEGPVYRGGPLPADEENALIERGAPFAWRLSIDRAREALGARFSTLAFTTESLEGEAAKTFRAAPEKFGDAVIARKDAGASYHLASVHDDALQGVSHVIRGEDLAEAAHLHTLLQALLDAPHPVYRTHKLITDETGKRLAKRDKAVTLRALRAGGASPGDIRKQLGL